MPSTDASGTDADQESLRADCLTIIAEIRQYEAKFAQNYGPLTDPRATLIAAIFHGALTVTSPGAIVSVLLLGLALIPLTAWLSLPLAIAIAASQRFLHNLFCAAKSAAFRRIVDSPSTLYRVLLHAHIDDVEMLAAFGRMHPVWKIAYESFLFLLSVLGNMARFLAMTAGVSLPKRR